MPCDVCGLSCGTRLTELAAASECDDRGGGAEWRHGVTKGGQWSQSRHCCTHSGHQHCTLPRHQAVVTNIDYLISAMSFECPHK